MIELINREDVQREIQSSFNLGAFRWQDGQDLMDRINALPTIDAVQHGEWILQASGRDCKCSVCERYWIPFGDEYDYKYCPNCGARMDRKEVQE